MWFVKRCLIDFFCLLQGVTVPLEGVQDKESCDGKATADATADGTADICYCCEVSVVDLAISNKY